MILKFGSRFPNVLFQIFCHILRRRILVGDGIVDRPAQPRRIDTQFGGCLPCPGARRRKIVRSRGARDADGDQPSERNGKTQSNTTHGALLHWAQGWTSAEYSTGQANTITAATNAATKAIGNASASTSAAVGARLIQANAKAGAPVTRNSTVTTTPAPWSKPLVAASDPDVKDANATNANIAASTRPMQIVVIRRFGIQMGARTIIGIFAEAAAPLQRFMHQCKGKLCFGGAMHQPRRSVGR